MLKTHLLFRLILIAPLFSLASCTQIYQAAFNNYDPVISQKNADKNINSIIEVAKKAEKEGKVISAFEKIVEHYECNSTEPMDLYPNANLSGESLQDMFHAIDDNFTLHSYSVGVCGVDSYQVECQKHHMQVGDGSVVLTYEVETTYSYKFGGCGYRSTAVVKASLHSRKTGNNTSITLKALMAQSTPVKPDETFNKVAKAMKKMPESDLWYFNMENKVLDKANAEEAERTRERREAYQAKQQAKKEKSRRNSFNALSNAASNMGSSDNFYGNNTGYITGGSQAKSKSSHHGASTSSSSSKPLLSSTNIKKPKRVTYYTKPAGEMPRKGVAACFNPVSIYDLEKMYIKECLSQYGKGDGINEQCVDQAGNKAINEWKRRYDKYLDKECAVNTPAPKGKNDHEM